jgi:small-conductance mechanosensitive channel
MHFSPGHIINNAPSITTTIAVIGAAVLFAITAHSILFAVIGYIGKRRDNVLYQSLIARTKNAARWCILLFAVAIAIPINAKLIDVREPGYVKAMIAPLTILFLTWLFIRFTDVLEDIIYANYHVNRTDPRAKSIMTQFQLLKRIIIVVIMVFAVGFALMSFPQIHKFGTAILASAGIVGIIVGVAAQRSVANLLAGIQIALTGPVRIGDAVVVEEEYGTVEEITLTYVVVKVWDNRRIVLPIVYFIEKPFQNWSRESVSQLGTVLLYADHTIPVEDIRAELLRLLGESPKWNGETASLQVTKTTHDSVELRAVMSARPENLWDLRCDIREKLLAFVRNTHPRSLPKIRAEIERPDGENS